MEVVSFTVEAGPMDDDSSPSCSSPIEYVFRNRPEPFEG
jgi:hypothetical protein